jgi:DNA-binding MarR family transcriptional regulator
MSVEEQILIELKRLNKLLILTNASILEQELTKYASSNERKKIWVLIDGNRSIDDLVRDSGLKRRSVYDFLESLEAKGLVERKWNEPVTRVIDFVPSNWIDNSLASITTKGSLDVQSTKGEEHG